MTYVRFVPGKDPGDLPIKIHDTEEHDCPSFRTEPPLLPFDPAFKVNPSRDEADMARSLDRYRRALR
jgi:hypothetical protein